MTVTTMVALVDDDAVAGFEIGPGHDLFDDADPFMAKSITVVTLSTTIKLFKIMLGPDTTTFQADSGKIVFYNNIACLNLGERLFNQF